ncbi:MAG: 4Fe-4S dicluster domain-containing protein [Spirochaetales bacterium]|nr:4Fe-4S dicluster domain-containing protein [Spirochaetales bacterium]
MITKKLMLFFPKCEVEKPIVYHLIKDYNLKINLIRAKITPEEYGYLVMDITGKEEDIERGLEYVKGFDVNVNATYRGLRHNEEKCTDCGNCLSHCPSGALVVEDSKTRKIIFKPDKCIECLACIRACPFNACISIF